MPLVSMKCNKKWYPVDRFNSRMFELARALPILLTENGEEILLTPGTPPDAVQVEVEKFGDFTINTPGVWIRVIFTEDPSDDPDSLLEAATSKIAELIKQWFDELDELRGSKLDRPEIALDVFWGPGHGCMMDWKGETTLSW